MINFSAVSATCISSGFSVMTNVCWAEILPCLQSIISATICAVIAAALGARLFPQKGEKISDE